MIILVTAFILGLTSSLHCIGMCGPIAVALPLNRTSFNSALLGILQYNFGRILTYSIMGLVAGFIGFNLLSFRFLQWFSILAGIVLILYAWKHKFRRINLGPNLTRIHSFTSRTFGRTMKSSSKFKLVYIGLLNGLLPCGLVYLALINAAVPGNVFLGAMAMALFGLGTIPLMALASLSYHKIRNNTKARMNKFLPHLISVVGLLIILRGMNLGIPFISPVVKAPLKSEVSAQSNEAEELIVECCHAKE